MQSSDAMMAHNYLRIRTAANSKDSKVFITPSALLRPSLERQMEL